MPVLSHFSLPRHFPVDERVRLAAVNGFDSIGLYIGTFLDLEANDEVGVLRDALDRYGVRLAEIEVIHGFGNDGIGGERVAMFEAAAFRLADLFGSRYLQVIGSEKEPVADAAAAFGRLCDRAADHGLVTGLECLPFTDVPDVCVARHIVEEADRPNGGLCVDIWHHVRGLNDLAAIAGLPGESITGIQMNDGPLVAADPTLDYKTDCLMNRVAPGDGEFDVAGFLAALAATGTTAPMSYEVCNLRGWDDPDAHVRRIGEVARKLGV